MERTINPTKRQRKALDRIATGDSVSHAMASVGYSPMSAKNPKNLTESKGFKILCEENGLTESLIVRALVSDIEAKPQKRVPELNLGAEILGMKEHEQTKTPSVVIVNVSGDIAKKYEIKTDAISERIKD